MALSYPLTLPADLTFAKSTFWLQRQVVTAGSGGGGQFAMDVGPALWRWRATSTLLSRRRYPLVMATLDQLEDGLGTFRARDPLRMRPWAYQAEGGGLAAPASFSGTLTAVAANNKDITLALAAGFAVTVGDYVQINYGDGHRALHRFMATATADGAGALSAIEVRPHVRPGWAAGNVVEMLNPFCFMRLVPGSIEWGEMDGEIGHGRVSFEAMQVAYA